MFGIRIRELREAKNLTQTELAKQLNSTQKQVSKWETEFIEPNIFWLCNLAKFFDVSVDYIVGLENDDGSKIIAVHNSFNNNSGKIDFKA